MRDLAEVLPAQPEQRGSVELGVAADVVVRVRVQRPSVAVLPLLLRMVFRVDVDRARAPVVLLAAHVVAALHDQDFLPGRREVVGQGAAAGAAADDDHVVMRHAGLSMKRHRKMQRMFDGWCSFAQRTCPAPWRRTYSSAASSMPSGGAVK